MRTVEIQLFKFEELSEEGKKAALINLHDLNVSHDWWDYHYDDGLGNTSAVFTREDDVSLIGSFIADAETQIILIVPEDGSTDPGLSAYVLRELVGPAWGEYPTNGADGVPLDATLNWNMGMIHDPVDPNALIVNPDNRS